MPVMRFSVSVVRMNLTEHRVHERERERTVSCEFVPPFLAPPAVCPFSLELLVRLFPFGIDSLLHDSALIPCRS